MIIFFKYINLSFLRAPRIFALKSGNFSVNFFSGTFFKGQFFSIDISNILTLLFPKGTLSNAPGASNLLYSDLATSISGDIITSIGMLDLLNNFPHFPSRKSFVRILAIFWKY